MYIVNVVLRETVACWPSGAFVLGIVVSVAARAALAHRFPLLQVVVAGNWIVRATLIAIAGAIAGALYPAFKGGAEGPHRRAGLRIRGQAGRAIRSFRF